MAFMLSAMTAVFAGPVVINGTQTKPSCVGLCDANITLNPTGGTAPYTYLWNTGATTNVLNGLCAATYTVTVTDASGQTAVQTRIIRNPNPVKADVTVTNVLCHDACNGTATAVAYGGTGSFTYLWSNGQTGAVATGLCAGTYDLTITDGNGCVGYCNAKIVEPVALHADLIKSDIKCKGSCNGNAYVVVTGGSGAYHYQWSNGAADNDSTDALCAMQYSVTVTDANGCSVVLNFEILEPSSLVLNVNSSDALCYKSCNGTASVGVQGGVGPYSYAWSTGATISSVSDLCAGRYTVVVTDANGCSSSSCSVINEPASLVVSTNKTDVKCKNSCTGTASAIVTGGNSGYAYVWSNNVTGNVISNLCAGLYSVVVTDSKGCTGSGSVNVSEPLQSLAASCTVIKNASYQGASDGQMSASATGGVSPYSYMWSNGNNTQVISNLTAGVYTATITDANGCTSVTSCTITANLQCGGFRTQTMGGWGSTPHGNNPGAYLAANFAGAFPNGLTVGCTKTLTLTSAVAVRNFLPSGSTPRALTQNLLNPGNSYSNVLAGQIVALTLSVRFDDVYPSFSTSQTPLGAQVIANGPFAGYSVRAVLDTANKILGGCSTRFSYSQINDMVSTINEYYDNGTTSNGIIRIVCPGTVCRVTMHGDNKAEQAKVYPNPFNSAITINIEHGREADVTIVDIGGKVCGQMRTSESTIQTGENLLPGVYMINIDYNDGNKEVVKVVKTN